MAPLLYSYRSDIMFAHLRYLDFMEVHLKDTCNYELKQDLKNELATAILHLDVSDMPPLQTAQLTHCPLWVTSSHSVPVYVA